jgi:hypothetical protein
MVNENVKLKRESIDFGPCASPPYKSKKVFSSKASTKSIFSNSKVIAKHLAKSIPKPPNSLPVGLVAISNIYSELIEGDYFADNEANKTIVTYILGVFKCPDGYMSSQIYREVIKMPGWSILIAILCAIVFTIIINSYWPKLISMFRYLRKILSETMSITKGVEKIQENQERGVELLSIFSKQPPGSYPAASSVSTPSSSGKSSSNYCLWCWTVTCIVCGFLAAVFIAAVGLSLIISLKEPIMEP